MVDLVKHYQEIESKLNYTFKDKKLLMLAFIHRSFYNENRQLVNEHNERLEFLGDSVLGLMVSEYLYQNLPMKPEGELSQMRAQLVEATTCAACLQKLGCASYVLLGRGEKLNEGKGRDTILADLFEALIGAIYLDGGLEEARAFFWKHFAEDVQKVLREPLRNWKADLQDYSQKKYQKPPVYKVEKEAGPDHSKIFHVIAYLENREAGRGIGSSKKEAEQAAAEDAIKNIRGY